MQRWKEANVCKGTRKATREKRKRVKEQEQERERKTESDLEAQ
jgi:hypothetical protein